ncbi:hypothetical protein Emed_000449 [Eimeria media]
MSESEDLSQFLAHIFSKEFWKPKLTPRRFASLLGIVIIFCNLGERTGGASAYSVFNRGANYLLGDLRLGHVEQQLRHAEGPVEDDGRVVPLNAPIEIRSRDANKKSNTLQLLQQQQQQQQKQKQQQRLAWRREQSLCLSAAISASQRMHTRDRRELSTAAA